MADNKITTELAVIGGGPGGYAAAFMAADLGMQVTLIDPEENPGGVCLYRGCIPSKALLHVAKLMNEAAEAKEWGLTFTKPRINLTRMRTWKDDVVAKLTGGLGQLTRQRKITHLRGTATFIDGTTLAVTGADGAQSTLSFKHAILATGSSPSVIPGFPTDAKRILDSTSALEIKDIPSTMLVVGGGYIGLELGTVYAALGTKVTVVEMMPGLLPGADRDLVAVLKKRLDGILDGILLNTTVSEMKVQKNGVRVTLDGKKDGARTKMFDKVLVSVGRTPNAQGVGLEHTKIETDRRGVCPG